MEGAYYFVYETINLTNGKKYIGQHCTKDLLDGYFGSCKELKQDIVNGDKYLREIVQHYNNIYDLGDAEWERINGLNAVKNPIYYNKRNGRFHNECFEYGHREESKRKISEKLKGNKNPRYGKGYLISGNKNPMYGRKLSEESKRLISKSNKGKPAYNKGLKGIMHFKIADTKKMSEAKKGNKNPMYRMSLYNLWLYKYGELEAIIRYKRWVEKHKKINVSAN